MSQRRVGWVVVEVERRRATDHRRTTNRGAESRERRRRMSDRGTL